MFYKKIRITVFVFLFSVVNLCAQTEEYEQALDLIINSEEYASITKNKKKYHVSNEVILFSKLGKFYQEELEGYVPLSDKEVVLNAHERNATMELTSLNKKRCSKVQIYFSESKGNVFFAEMIESKKVVPYSERPDFGISQVYMFKKENDKVSLLNTREIAYN